ncbi:unnamed protein product [Caenorhabditis auriculariae]|uniref:26S proteasome non-ATPase regulatory subunit 8 n=1 Tax=Caenorhabditis auriculariae TaxID=2777116 RepID=A0A8S1HAV7_9PELO|nr:unnamed protein product [Caenorhabditis auriculariae]
MAALQKAHKELLDYWAKEPRDIPKIEKAIADISNVLGTAAPTGDQFFLVVSKDLHEISALLAVIKNNMDVFDDAITQVMTFYEMAPNHAEHKYLMIGLHLMYLLANNRLSDFHMLLEQVPHKEQVSNAYISTPVRLEQSLMEGAYNKVVLTEKNIPCPYYSIFIRTMVDTVRRDIATSIEKSFKVLTARDAATMLLFDSEAQLQDFAKQRNWKLQGSSFLFEAEVPMVQDNLQPLDTTRIATHTIFYAKQLEQIV